MTNTARQCNAVPSVFSHDYTGEVPIYESGLESIIKRNLSAQRLQFSDNIAKGVDFGELQFIAVGTPSSIDGSADLQFVLQVAQKIGQHLNRQSVIINKSTVPVGTAEKVKNTITEELDRRKTSVPFSVVSNLGLATILSMQVVATAVRVFLKMYVY